MTGRRLAGLALLTAFAPTAALACDHIYGIPGDARFRLVRLDPAAPGGAPEVLSDAPCKGRTRWAAASVPADGGVIAAWHADGLELHVGARRQLVKVPGWSSYQFPLDLAWSPDGRRLAFPLPGRTGADRAFAVLDLARLDAEQHLAVLPAPGPGSYGLEWEADGAAFLVAEHTPGSAPTTALRRVPVDGAGPSVVVEGPGAIDFFITPANHGRRCGAGRVAMLLGTADGLFVREPAGAISRFDDVPAVGVNAVDWHPTRDLAAVFFRRPVANGRGETRGGLWLVDMVRPAHWVELHDGLDVATVSFSPRGTYLGWTTINGVFYRRVGGDETVVIPAPETEDGIPLDARGCAWSQDEARLAWCAGAKVFVRDLATGKDRVVADDLFKALGGRADESWRAFAAQPHWVGDRLLVTLIEDLSPSAPERAPPRFGGFPGKEPPPPDELRARPPRRR